MTLTSQPQPAPSQFIKWFCQELELAGEDIQIFVDPSTDLEIGVFRNIPVIRERLQITIAAPAPRHPLPSSPQPQPVLQQGSPSPTPHATQGGSSPDYGSDLDEGTLTQLEKSVQGEQLVDLQGLVHTTSNKNKTFLKRQAEKEARRGGAVQNGRVAKPTTRARRAQRKQLSATRVVVEDEAMTESDHVHDEALVDQWFAGFPVDQQGTLLTRTKQAKIKRMAMAIGGPEVVEDWQAFMTSWRENGFLTSRPTSKNNQLAPKHLDGLPVEVTDFYYAYDRVKTTEIADSFKAITHRFRMARLWMIYAKAEDTTIQSQPLLQPGQTRQAQQKRFLFNTLYPGFVGITDIDTNKASKKPWDAFTNRLRFAKRWYTLQAELGYGILGLIPERVVPNRWVQKELNTTEFTIWIHAIKHFTPGFEKASQRWRRTIDQALNGLQPSRRRKAIEGITPAALRGFTDTTSLFYDEDENEDENLVPLSQLVGQGESRRDVMSFLGDMGLEGTNPGLLFTEEQQVIFENLDPQQIQGFRTSGASQETVDSWSWSEERAGNEGDEEDSSQIS